VGKAVRVIVLEMDRTKSNVLVSRRRVIENEKSIKRTETLESIQVGQVKAGRVTGLTNFGAFVDIGGIEGLLHVSDISWTRIDNPQSALKVGDKIDVKILKYDPASHRISLGRKQLLAHPWEGIETRHPIGSTIKGKVTGLAEFGAFVEIEPGVEGLIHVSELSWTERVKRPHALLKVGQEVEAKLTGIDREKEKISLSLRRMGQSPWEQALKQHPVGSKVEGEITHIAAFGAFVKIPAGVEALLKTQDISWTDKIQSPSQALKVGDKITAIVLEVNPNEEKMSLGLKQLQPDPMKALKPGQSVNATVSKVTDFGLVVKLENGVEGFVRQSETYLQKSIFGDDSRDSRDARAAREKPADAPAYKEGDAIQATVTKIGKKDRKVELSIRKYEKDQEKELLRKYSGSKGNPTLGETMGWEDPFPPQK
jgi:small subunit ribosomal protein S1